MAVKYHYFKNPSGAKNEGIHPRLVSTQQIDVNYIARRVTARSSFTAGDVAGMMTLVRDILLEELMQGSSFYWEDFGIFSLSLSSAPMTEGKELIPSRVYCKKINIRLAKRVKQKLSQIKFERSDRHSSEEPLTPEHRQKRIVQYLQKQSFIQTSQAARINACSNSTAFRDLKKLKAEGVIEEIAGTNMTLYTLSKQLIP